MIYMKMSVYKILDSQGRLVLPAELRNQVDIQKGYPRTKSPQKFYHHRETECRQT